VTAPVKVTLGPVGTRSLTPTVYGLLDRGARLRPDLAAEVRGRVRITFADDHADVRVVLTGTEIVVADHDLAASDDAVDLEIRAGLHDLVVLMAAPLAKGLPKPTNRQGRAALGRLADGRVDFVGSLGLARRFLRLMSVAPER
jgi:hypothetical protein